MKIELFEKAVHRELGFFDTHTVDDIKRIIDPRITVNNQCVYLPQFTAAVKYNFFYYKLINIFYVNFIKKDCKIDNLYFYDECYFVEISYVFCSYVPYICTSYIKNNF